MSNCDCAWKNGQHHEMCAMHIKQTRENITQLRAQLAEAREVIEFYGAEKSYVIPAGEGSVADYLTATCPAQDDIGQKARDFLAKYPEGKE